MMDFLIAWYALGFVACGTCFAIERKLELVTSVYCFLFPPLAFFAALVISIVESEQYLWKKP